MHVEPLEKLPRSVREFLSHYAMIVLSILTALALEEGALSLEHRHQGERARSEIEHEIAMNRDQLEASLRDTRDNLKLWQGLLAQTVAEVNAGQSTDASRLAIIAKAGNNFRDSTPALTTAAWDAALADHAVDYLQHDELTHYSSLYALQRFFSTALWETVRESGARGLNDFSLPGYLGKADPTATITALNGRVRALEIMTSQLSQMDEALKAPSPAAEHAAGGASAASR